MFVCVGLPRGSFALQANATSLMASLPSFMCKASRVEFLNVLTYICDFDSTLKSVRVHLALRKSVVALHCCVRFQNFKEQRNRCEE